jgi:hypothetical protein
MVLTSKDNLGLGFNELDIGKLESPAFTLALSSELEVVRLFPFSDESSPIF